MSLDLNDLSDIEKFAKIWQIELNMEYLKPEKNVRLSFKDVGPFCEYLATSFLPGYVGGGSGGMGFDLINLEQGKAFEVKSCCTIQNAKCPKCGAKFNDLFQPVCPDCQELGYIEIGDSRFGINADETLRQIEKGIFEGFIFCHVSKVSQDKNNGELKIKAEWFKLVFDSELKDIQLSYFITQATKGKKPHCNLLPGKIDFYKLCPLKIYEIEMIVNYKDLNTTPIIKETECNEFPRVPISVLRKNEREIAETLSSYDKETNTVDCKEFTMNIDYRVKALGKERGDTRANLDKRIKKQS